MQNFAPGSKKMVRYFLFLSGPMALALTFQNCSKFESNVVMSSGDGSKAALSLIKTSDSCPTGWICPSQKVYSSKVGTWYQVFWEGSESSWRWGSRYKPVRGYYSNTDPLTVKSQIEQMKSTGIDYAVMDLSNMLIDSGQGISAPSVAGAETFFSVMESLPPDQRIPLAIGIGGQLGWGGPDRKGSLEYQNKEADEVYNRFAQRAVYFKWYERPLLLQYQDFSSANTFHGNWDDARFSVRRTSTWVSEKAFPEQAQWAQVHGFWGWIVEYPQPLHSEVMTVVPGAENIHLNVGGNYELNRENGAYFQKTWLRAIQKNPETIFLASWNCWIDETAIEPAESFGKGPAFVDSYGNSTPDLYLQIATAYTQLRTGLMPNTFYRDENASAIYEVVNGQLQCRALAPEKKPVIALPSGLLTQLGAPSCANVAIPAIDFMGLYGWGSDASANVSPFLSPPLSQASCPSGAYDSQVFGSDGKDWPMRMCYRPSTANTMNFGGMYGYGSKNGGMFVYANPMTGGASCPSGYLATRVLGTGNLDWDVFVCTQPADKAVPKSFFGGMYGYGALTGNGLIEGRQPNIKVNSGLNGVTPSIYVNPLTGTASCPAGYVSSQILGADGLDWPLYFCYRRL